MQVGKGQDPDQLLASQERYEEQRAQAKALGKARHEARIVGSIVCHKGLMGEGKLADRAFFASETLPQQGLGHAHRDPSHKLLALGLDGDRALAADRAQALGGQELEDRLDIGGRAKRGADRIQSLGDADALRALGVHASVVQCLRHR